MLNIKNFTQPLIFGLYSVSSLICALFLSWVIWASIDFAYPALHDFMDIEQHTVKYGPQNRYRDHFENTDREERIRLFASINNAIHNHGNGLKEIEYFDQTTNKKINTLLHTSEILHLKDVAKLIDVFRITAFISLIILLSIVIYFYKRNQTPPNIKQQSLSTLLIIGLCTITVLIIGPVNVFYAFHEWFFPADHKWFFYYQESLMTILMKAPFLFGYIAILILLLAIPIYIGINIVGSKLLTFFNINK
jgi:uncharacterized membrane protein